MNPLKHGYRSLVERPTHRRDDVVGKFSSSIQSVRLDEGILGRVEQLKKQCVATVSMCDLLQCIQDPHSVGEVAAKRLSKVLTGRLAANGVDKMQMPACVQTALDDLDQYLPVNCA